MQLARAQGEEPLKRRFVLPPAVPPFNTTIYRIFSFFWVAIFLLALAGPPIGVYFRYSAPADNSQLLLGSRAGFAVSPQDATTVRFPVGPNTSRAGIKAGDHIVAIYGLPLPAKMPMTEEALAQHQDDPAYIAMGNLLFGTDPGEVPLTVRSPDGRERELTVVTGEIHMNAAAREMGFSPKLLNFVDLLHVISYPFLLWAAWILHRRNSRDAVSSILSLAILLTMSAEQPSATFLAGIGIPRSINVALYDLGNVLLLAGILLFPIGTLSWRLVVLIACLPVLMLLQGTIYSAVFVAFMIAAVLLLLRSMRQTPSSDLKMQIRWALFGFSGYAVLRGVSILCDMLKWSTDRYGQQLLLEVAAGVSLGLGVLLLQLGLLVALLRYRLYDAEAIIGRTVSVAIVTLVISGGFAAVMEGIITSLQFIYPESDTSQTLAAMAGAIFAAGCIEPVRDKVRTFTERKFQKNLFLLREDLPEAVRDLRETASMDEMLEEVLARITRGVNAVRAAAVVHGRVMKTRDVTVQEVEDWRSLNEGFSRDLCDSSDRIFPLRVRLVPSSDNEASIGFILIGPRPDGSISSREEQKALAAVSETIARAIRMVVKREEYETGVADLIEANARRIEQIEALLHGRSSPAGKLGPRSA